MIPLDNSIRVMYQKFYIDIKFKQPSKESFLSQVEYERVIFNKICCIAEDLKFYKVLDDESYYSIQDALIDCYKSLNDLEYEYNKGEQNETSTC